MAKLNWKNFKYKQNRHFPDYSYSAENQYDFDRVLAKWRNTPWPINGKYKGTLLLKLPQTYLEWIYNNFNQGSIGYILAKQELDFRNETAHKVSGPVDNSAVEKAS